jgi:hypothetical protein
MATYYSPKIVTDGLVFCLDAASRNGISALGCGGFNGAPQLVKNMASSSDVITDFGGVRLGNLTYYTAFAIDYPEGNYGGDAAGRHGITPGYNVRSGAKTYTTGRALHMYAWNNATNAWIEGEFTGTYGSGHQYDNYTGSEVGYANELTKFVTDYNNIKTKYPDVTFIVIGSHRSDRYTQAVRDILTDLGKPSGYIDSDYIAAPEWILIGKPGLGAGNYYGWAYENYTTNPSQVAHLNFGLPLFGSKDNYFLFDGVDDYFSIPNVASLRPSTEMTISMWVKAITNTAGWNILFGQSPYTGGPLIFLETGGSLIRALHYPNGSEVRCNTNYAISTSAFTNVVFTFKTGDAIRSYFNGVANTTVALSAGTFSYNTSNPYLIGYNGGSWFNGQIGQTTVYNRALSAAEVLQNYNAIKGRFGL